MILWADEPSEEEASAKRRRFDDDEASRPAVVDPDEDPVYPEDVVGIVQASYTPVLDRRGRYDVCEAFSPPRIVPFAEEAGLRGGWSMNLIHKDGVTKKHWNLLSPADRAEAHESVRRDKPGVLSLSPPCTKFSALQRLRTREMDPVAWDEAVAMVNFAVELA